MRFKQLDKNPREKQKKRLWSPDEDEKLRSYIHTHGVTCWNTVPINAGLLRNGKSCRFRWINYLSPGLKREKFSLEEEEKITRLHNKMGNKWSQMARSLPGRTDNEIKNHWHTNLKKCRGNKDGIISQTDANHKKCISIHGENPPTIPYTFSYEYFGKTEESPADIDQSSTELHKRDVIRNLPKVFFTDWLIIDQTHVEIVQSSDNLFTTKNLHDQYKSNFQDSSVQSLLLDEDMLYGIQNCSSYGMFYPTLTYENHIVEVDKGDDHITGVKMHV